MYYEAHITIDPIREHMDKATVELLKWKYSSIDGDPSLGAGIRAYATNHYATSQPIEEVIKQLANCSWSLKNMGCSVIRTKLELVVYDSKEKE